jgi:hypothetical protein
VGAAFAVEALADAGSETGRAAGAAADLPGGTGFKTCVVEADEKLRICMEVLPLRIEFDLSQIAYRQVDPELQDLFSTFW